MRSSNPTVPVAILIVALVLAFVLGPITADAASRYVPGINDLPLMDGLEPVEGPTDFSTPSSRFVVAYAKGRAAKRAVAEFYAVTLPQLGWTRTGETAYRREAETLQLDFDDTPPMLTVRFTLSPRP